MFAMPSIRDPRRIAHPGMRLERLLNTRCYLNRPKARRRLFVSVYGRIAMLRKRYDAFRSQRMAALIAIIKAIFAKKAEHQHKVHHVFQPPKVLRTQRR